NRLVDEGAKFRKINDFGFQRGDLLLGQPEQLAVDIDVLEPGELWVEASAKFQQGCHAPLDADAARAGQQGAGDQLEQGALPGAIYADDPGGAPGGHLQIDVLQGMKQFMPFAE